MLGTFTSESIRAGLLHKTESDVSQPGLIHGLVEAQDPLIGRQNLISEAAHRVGHGGEAIGDIIEIETQCLGHAADQRIGAKIAHEGIAQILNAISQAGQHGQPVSGSQRSFIKTAKGFVDGIGDCIESISNRISRGPQGVSRRDETEQLIKIEVEGASGKTSSINMLNRHQALLTGIGEIKMEQFEGQGRLQAQKSPGVRQLHQSGGT